MKYIATILFSNNSFLHIEIEANSKDDAEKKLISHIRKNGLEELIQKYEIIDTKYLPKL